MIEPTYKSENVELYLGDCFDILSKFSNMFVAVLTDVPYGITYNKWDTLFDVDRFWKLVLPILSGTFVSTADMVTGHELIRSNKKYFKYELVWDKGIPSGMFVAKYRPMRQHELLFVFQNKLVYNPQKEIRDVPIKSGGQTHLYVGSSNFDGYQQKDFKKEYVDKFPISILNFKKVRHESVHPTQKPIELYVWLVKTYSNYGDSVLDPFMGSGTTGLACLQEGRKFVGIEKDEKYFEIALNRIKAVENELYRE